MAVTVGTTTPFAGTDELTSGAFTYPHDHDTNSGIVVCITWIESILSAGGVSLDAMIFGGSTLDRIGTQSAGTVNTEIWGLASGLTGGLQDLEITWGNDLTGAVSYVLTIFSANGRPTVFGVPGAATGASTTPTVDISCESTTSLVVNALSIANGLSGDTTIMADDNDPGAGVDTEANQSGAGTGTARIQGAVLAGVGIPGTRTTSWTLGASRTWGTVAVELLDEQLQDPIGMGGVVVFPR